MQEIKRVPSPAWEGLAGAAQAMWGDSLSFLSVGWDTCDQTEQSHHLPGIMPPALPRVLVKTHLLGRMW